MFTRKQYITGKCSHSEYYGQYVVDEIKNKVLWLGKTNLVEAYSMDEDFNTIPLSRWDGLSRSIKFPPTVDDDYWTLAGKVCVLKEAARQIVMEENKKNFETTPKDGTAWKLVQIVDDPVLKDGYYYKNAGDPPTFVRVEEKQETQDVHFHITICLVARIPVDSNPADFILELTYDFVSGTEAEIIDTEIMKYEVLE